MSEISSRESDDDNDATDELPVLSEAEIVAVGESSHEDAEEAHTATGEHAAPVPFPQRERRADSDARTDLEHRLASLENRFGERDSTADRLERRIDEITRGSQSLESQLGRNTAAVESAARELTTLRDQLDAVRSAVEHEAASAGDLTEAHAAREAAERARAEAETELDTLRKRLAERESELEAARAEAAAAGAVHSDADARAEIEALTAYITNRREHWDALEARCAEQARRIRELEAEVEQRVARQHEADERATRESARAAEYRDELTRLAARHGPETGAAPASSAPRGTLEEFEQQLVELRGTLDEQHERLESTADWRSPDVGGDDSVQERLAAAEAELEQARGELHRLEQAVAEREPSTDARGERVAALQAQLSAQVEQLRDLQDAADARAAAPEDHTGEHATAGVDVPAQGSLVCLTSDEPAHYPVNKRVLLIGRSGEADIRIATHFVSREHARVRNDGRAVLIEDLGSTNGVFVNSVRIDSHELQDGDWITIGESQFRYVASDPA